MTLPPELAAQPHIYLVMRQVEWEGDEVVNAWTEEAHAVQECEGLLVGKKQPHDYYVLPVMLNPQVVVTDLGEMKPRTERFGAYVAHLESDVPWSNASLGTVKCRWVWNAQHTDEIKVVFKCQHVYKLRAARGSREVAVAAVQVASEDLRAGKWSAEDTVDPSAQGVLDHGGTPQ